MYKKHLHFNYYTTFVMQIKQTSKHEKTGWGKEGTRKCGDKVREDTCMQEHTDWVNQKLLGWVNTNWPCWIL